MGMTAVWHNRERTVIRLEFEGRWTVDDLKAIGNTIARMRDGVPRPLGLVIDFQDSDYVPDQIVEYAAAIADRRDARLDLITVIVLVGAGRLIQALYKAFRKTYGGDGRLTERIVLASSWEEAQALLSERHGATPAAS